MRAVLQQLLAVGMCFGLFIVTCTLTAQAAAPAPEMPNCCSFSADPQHCASESQNDREVPERCCGTHSCGGLIAAADSLVWPASCGLAQRTLDISQEPTSRAHRLPVPPPRFVAGKRAGSALVWTEFNEVSTRRHMKYFMIIAVAGLMSTASATSNVAPQASGCCATGGSCCMAKARCCVLER